jgi:hypothetical protein
MRYTVETNLYIISIPVLTRHGCRISAVTGKGSLGTGSTSAYQ